MNVQRARLGMLVLLVAMAFVLGPASGVAGPLHRLARSAAPLAFWVGQQAAILICAALVYACAIWMEHLDRRPSRRSGPR